MARARDGKPKQRARNVKNEAEDKSQPFGAYLTAAAKAQRDSLMVQRKIQRWPIEAIAQEAGITATTAERAIAKKLKEYRERPLLDQGPTEALEDLVQGIYLSVGDFEAMAVAALSEHRNISAAVGAKKAANEARLNLLAILQSTGRLPKELGLLRHLFDLREISGEMIDEIDRLASGDRTPAEVREFFYGLLGVREVPELAPPDVDLVED